MVVDRTVTKYPGQVETILFNLEQVESLASPARSEVFWSFSSHQPTSVAELAEGLGKSAQTIHYHVAELVKQGLLLAVGERKRHARTEKLYVRAAINFYDQGPKAPPEYRKHVVDGFAAMARTMVRETEVLNEIAEDEGTQGFSHFRRAFVRLSPEKAKEFRKRMAELVDLAKASDVEDGVQVHLATYMRPSLAESRKRIKAKKEG
jgi:predicted ArsR family transcriptional regulator